MITLKTLPKASAQQVFNQVAKHLLTQNKSSMIGHTCCYRSDKGLMCAAGCLMSDTEAKKIIESKNNTLGWTELADQGYVGDDHFDLIRELQYIHDKSNPSQWEKKLISLAKKFNFNTTVINKFKKTPTKKAK